MGTIHNPVNKGLGSDLSVVIGSKRIDLDEESSERNHTTKVGSTGAFSVWKIIHSS